MSKKRKQKCLKLVQQIKQKLILYSKIPLFIIQIDFMHQSGLQENSIILLSGGFTGPFVLQAFCVNKIPPPEVGLVMCLTDGNVYIGAKYKGKDYPQVQDYWLLQITAQFNGQTQPIKINSLLVVSTFPKKLLGNPPCTLTDYFNKLVTKPSEERLGQPTKRVKYSHPSDFPLLKNSDNKKPAEKERPSAQFSMISPSLYKKKQEIKVKTQSDKKNNEKKLKLADSDEGSDKEQEANHKKQNGGSAKKQNKIEVVAQSQDDSIKNCLISDLYERKTDWTILCRVNYLNTVQCKNQHNAKNFMLNDQVGNQIKCVYFYTPLEDCALIQVGKYYSFSGGQVSKTNNKTDGVKQLQIIFDKSSTIIPRNNIQFEMNLSKFCRIADIPLNQVQSEINVIGIIKNIKFLDQSNKNKFRYNSTICDPLSGYEIDFILFLNHREKPPEQGTIGFLHNYQLFKQNNVCRLNSTYRSYFKQQLLFKDPLTPELKKARDSKDWEHIYYKNLSSIPFVFRTVKQLKRAIYSTDDQKVYSLIDCWVLDIGKKKFYHACKICKKGTDKKTSGVFYCPNCQKNVETFHCHTLTATFADYTSHFSLDVIGEHAETLIELKNIEFYALSQEKQLIHLDSLKCKNVTLKLKTQRRQKRQSHSVWAIESSNAINTLKEIRKKMQQRKMRIDQKW